MTRPRNPYRLMKLEGRVGLEIVFLGMRGGILPQNENEAQIEGHGGVGFVEAVGAAPAGENFTSSAKRVSPVGVA